MLSTSQYIGLIEDNCSADISGLDLVGLVERQGNVALANLLQNPVLAEKYHEAIAEEEKLEEFAKNAALVYFGKYYLSLVLKSDNNELISPRAPKFGGSETAKIYFKQGVKNGEISCLEMLTKIGNIQDTEFCLQHIENFEATAEIQKLKTNLAERLDFLKIAEGNKPKWYNGKNFLFGGIKEQYFAVKSPSCLSKRNADESIKFFSETNLSKAKTFKKKKKVTFSNIVEMKMSEETTFKTQESQATFVASSK